VAVAVAMVNAIGRGNEPPVDKIVFFSNGLEWSGGKRVNGRESDVVVEVSDGKMVVEEDREAGGIYRLHIYIYKRRRRW